MREGGIRLKERSIYSTQGVGKFQLETNMNYLLPMVSHAPSLTIVNKSTYKVLSRFLLNQFWYLILMLGKSKGNFKKD